MDFWNIESIHADIVKRSIADDREALSLARWMMEDVLEVKPRQPIDAEKKGTYDNALIRLAEGEPVQYIAGHAWFFGEKFKVTPEVLIPRPETEELVDWIVSDFRNAKTPLRILDIGTGSGCIAIMLKKKLGVDCAVMGIDISTSALQVAKENSLMLKAEVTFMELDFLVSSQQLSQSFDIIVSNPPYVEKKLVDENVISGLRYEPEGALYPPGEDVDIFYRRISEFGSKALAPNGICYLELNEFRADLIKALFEGKHWLNAEVRKDMQGLPRMLKVSKG